MAIQSAGIPCPWASDEAMFDYWQGLLDPLLFLVDIQDRWVKEAGRRLVRQSRNVVALSDDEEERLAAIHAGFTDALPSHMPARELAAKLAARFIPRDPPPATQPGQVGGPLAVDLPGKRATWWDKEVELSPLLFDLAAYFVARPRMVIPVKTLLRDVWREEWAHSAKAHKAVWRLRETLDPEADVYLQTKGRHGYGYFPE